MADKKISALTGATTPLAGTEVLPVVQSGNTVNVAVDNLTIGKSVTAARFGAGGTPSVVFDAAAGTGADLNLRFSPSGWNTKHRLGVQYTGDGVVWSNNALMTSATSGNLDDVSNSGSALLLNTSGVLNYVTASAGANPRTFTNRWTADATGDFTLSTGNFVVGTAGKGIDFSANGGDVLKQYDEGTWTPVVTASSGAITSYTSSGRFTRVGREVTAVLTFKLTNAGTASGAIIATLPFSSDAAITYIGCGRDDNLGSMLQGRVITAIPGSVYITTYANASIAVTNTEVFLTIQYFV